MKKKLSLILAICTMFSMSTVALAAEPEYKSMMDDAETRQKILASAYADNVAPNYISVDEYLTKYGTTNVIKGFNKAEIDHKANVLKTANAAEKASLNKDVASFSSEPNDLYLSIKEGEFLGMEVQGVSDISPDNHNFTIKLKDKGYTPTANINVLGEPIPTSTNAQTIKPYTNYSVYYSDNQPGTTDLNNAYEPLSGSYIYKYSYAFEGNYLCSTDVTFNNTKLRCGTQDNNMYVYVAAKSSQQTLDFGLMANPAASNRNQGLYACYNPGDGSFYVEAYPKVNATSYSTSNKTMTLENKTVTIRLSIGTGTAEMYMESGGECIFYKVIDMSTLISGTSAALTFIQAISCVEANNANTSLTSGSYFRNVKFSNNKLYSYTNGTRNFPTFGSATYYLFACKPSAIDFSYGTNTETISIEYN